MLPPYGRCQVCHITAANSGVDGKRTHCASCATDDMCQIGGYCIVCHDVTAAFGYEDKAMESPPKCGYFVDALYYYYDDRSLGAIEHIKV